jgi:hypothetical protein
MERDHLPLGMQGWLIFTVLTTAGQVALCAGAWLRRHHLSARSFAGFFVPPVLKDKALLDELTRAVATDTKFSTITTPDNAIIRRTATGDDCHLVDQAPRFTWRHCASCKFVAPMIAGLEPTRTAANVANPPESLSGLANL